MVNVAVLLRATKRSSPRGFRSTKKFKIKGNALFYPGKDTYIYIR